MQRRKTLRHAQVAARSALGCSLVRQYLDEEYRGNVEGSARREDSGLEHPKLETMTLLADAVACWGNAGKLALYHGRSRFGRDVPRDDALNKGKRGFRA